MTHSLAQHAITTLLLAAIVALICTRRGVPPALRHALWVLVLVKLLIPPVLFWPWSLSELLPKERAVSMQDLPLPRPPSKLDLIPEKPGDFRSPAPAAKLEESPSIPILTRDFAKEFAAPAKSPEPPQVSTAIPSSSQHPEVTPATWWSALSWQTVLLSAWLLGSLVVLCLQFAQIIIAAQRLRAAQPPPRWLTRMLRELAVKFEVQPPRVVVTEAVLSPVLWHLGRPVLLWPARSVAAGESSGLRGILSHELAHLRRKDHWTGWLLLVAGWVWWWHPLYWLARRQVRLHAEEACDAWVTWAFPEDRRTYAEALLRATAQPQTLSWAPVLGMGGGPRSHFRRRLTMIMSSSVAHRVPWRIALPLLFAALLLVPSWSLGQTEKIQADIQAKLQAERLRAALEELEVKKATLNAELAKLQQQLAQLQDQESLKRTELENRRLVVSDAIVDLDNRLAERVNVNSTNAADFLSQVYLAHPSEPRSWGPEQVTGPPNVTEAGDNSLAWASKTTDTQDEWLLLEYEKPATPTAFLIFENFNPGAVYKVSVFTADDRELEIWKRKAVPESGKKVTVVSPQSEFPNLKTKKVKVYLKSTDVPGWNEIDAVGLMDASGAIQWAKKATASSSYADKDVANDRAGVLSEYLNVSRNNINGISTDSRLDKVEKQMAELKTMMEEMLRRSQTSPGVDRNR